MDDANLASARAVCVAHGQGMWIAKQDRPQAHTGAHAAMYVSMDLIRMSMVGDETIEQGSMICYSLFVVVPLYSSTFKLTNKYRG